MPAAASSSLRPVQPLLSAVGADGVLADAPLAVILTVAGSHTVLACCSPCLTTFGSWSPGGKGANAGAPVPDNYLDLVCDQSYRALLKQRLSDVSASRAESQPGVST